MAQPLKENDPRGIDVPDNKEEEKTEMNNDASTSKLNYASETVVRMPTDRFASHYNMSHKSRGLAFIFNHKLFDEQEERTGTDQDKKNLEEVLKKLGFDVTVFQDLKYDDIERQIKRVAKYDHSECDCLCISVLTHGDTGILHAKDGPYKPDLLWSSFSADCCPSLAGKPKIFFLQACRGDKLDGGVIMQRTKTDGHLDVESYRIPAQADFLIVYSTVNGYYSWRNPTRGSWFIQALCEELKHRGFDLDLGTLLTFVSQRVAFDFESNVPDKPKRHQQKQIPCVMSMLTRLIKFTKGKEE